MLDHVVDNSEMSGPVESPPVYLDLLGRVKKALEEATEVRVPVEDIRRFEEQPRDFFDESHINGLRESIDAGGQTTPGMVRYKPAQTPYELIDGECRWLGIQRIPSERRPLYRANLIKADDDVVQFLLSGVANFNRRGHTPLEVMNTVAKYLSFGFPIEEIARLLGISVAWAEDMHDLRKLRTEVQNLLNPKITKQKKDRLPITAAIQIAKADHRFQLQLAQRVIAKDVTLSGLRKETVRVSQAAGVPIRVRAVSARHRRDEVGNKLEVALRNLSDTSDLLIDPAVKVQIKSRGDAPKLLGQIGEIEKMIVRCRRFLEAQMPAQSAAG
jgi:ParB/RepB/Spo0J family partition protein